MNNEEKTLVILTPGFPETEADSTCLPMQQQFVKSLKTIDPRLNIIILSFQYPYHSKTYNWFGNTVISFNGRNKGGLSKLLLRRKINAALKNIKNKTKITGLLSFWYNECALVGKRFADKYGIPHYCWILGQDAKKENRYPHRIPLLAGELIALSDFLQEEFEKNHGIHPQRVIPPGIDTKLFPAGVQERDIDILAAGSLIPLKQFEIFIEIVAGIKDHFPGVKAVLTGEGPEKEKLKALIHMKGLQDNIELTGELPYPEVLETMKRSKVFIHPSSYEGFSGVCLEALAAGAYVISFSRPMKREIEYWFIAGSVEEMQQKTLSILKDPLPIYRNHFIFPIENTASRVMELFGN